MLYNKNRGDIMNNKSDFKIELINRYRLEKAYYCFDFKKPVNLHFIEGQYSIFGLIDKDIKDRKQRAFSIASTNKESFIRVATRIVDSPSEYKNILLQIPIGEQLTMAIPRGKFILEEAYDAVFIAGGIGITPIRSILLSEKRNKRLRNDVLIYSELEWCYPFKPEFEKLSGLEIICAADVEPTQKIIIENANKYKNKAYYYISGSPGFVKGITALLNSNGILNAKIKFDIFTGY